MVMADFILPVECAVDIVCIRSLVSMNKDNVDDYFSPKNQIARLKQRYPNPSDVPLPYGCNAKLYCPSVGQVLNDVRTELENMHDHFIHRIIYDHMCVCACVCAVL
jgi:hypothetical protein